MMGHNTMKTANGKLYRTVRGLDFRVLMFLAQGTLDHESREGVPERTWFGGVAPIVEFLYEVKPLKGQANGGAEYHAKCATIQQSLHNLIRADAIRRIQPGKGGGKSSYEICPLQGSL
jgi:hypothetical protein